MSTPPQEPRRPAAGKPFAPGGRPWACVAGVVLLAAQSTLSAQLYTASRLQLPSSVVFFDTRVLSQDGTAGGYVRISNETAPFDVPAVWGTDGAFRQLAVNGPYEQANVSGFGGDASVLGSVIYPGPVTTPRPTVWTEAGMRTISEFGMGGVASKANSTIICGETGDPSITSGYVYRLTLWDADGTNPRVVTGLEGVQGRCFGLNAGGTYVGVGLPDASFAGFGFVGRDGSAARMEYPGFNIIRAFGVNDDDWVVGAHEPQPGQRPRGYVARAFGSEIRDLGLIDGYAGLLPRAINNDGWIVGAALGATTELALIWRPGDAGPTDLNALVSIPGETRLVEAMDINEAGQILARGFGGYYILTPVPEPGLAVLGTAGVLALRRRRREGEGVREERRGPP